MQLTWKIWEQGKWRSRFPFVPLSNSSLQIAHIVSPLICGRSILCFLFFVITRLTTWGKHSDFFALKQAKNDPMMCSCLNSGISMAARASAIRLIEPEAEFVPWLSSNTNNKSARESVMSISESKRGGSRLTLTGTSSSSVQTVSVSLKSLNLRWYWSSTGIGWFFLHCEWLKPWEIKKLKLWNWSGQWKKLGWLRVPLWYLY